MGFWRALSRGRIREDRGAYAILFAILVIVIFTLVAIVVDLGEAKAIVRGNQSVADFASLAAGPDLEAANVNPQTACTHAWQYLVANLVGLPAGTASPCSSFPTSCSDTTTPAATYTVNAGSFTITFRYPVPDGDPLLGAARPGDNGEAPAAQPCRRLGITVRTMVQTLFGGITGSNGLSAPASAVVRATRFIQKKDIAALLILDPFGCNALTDGGNNTQIWVHSSGPPPAPQPESAGLITLDSNASTSGGTNGCSNNSSYTIDTNDTGNLLDKIKAFPTSDGATPGQIELFALPAGATTCPAPGAGHACQAADVTSGRMNPQPTHLDDRATRAPADYAFDCLPDYSALAAAGDLFPDTGTLQITTCPQSDPTQPSYIRPYISDLRTAIGRTGTSVPTLFTKWTDLPQIAALPANKRCAPPSPVTIRQVDATAIYVNCGTLNAANGITIDGANVVLEGSLSIGSTGFFNLNNNNTRSLTAGCKTDIQYPCDLQSSANTAFMFFRDGGSLSKGSQASMNLNRVMVYIDNTHNLGNIALGGGGNGTLIWKAPTLEGPWVHFDAVSGAQSGTLALWSESQQAHTLNGQAGMDVEGVFFTPGANYFNFHGQGLQTQTSAQFITYRLNVDGEGRLEMTPNPATSLPLIKKSYELIR